MTDQNGPENPDTIEYPGLDSSSTAGSSTMGDDAFLETPESINSLKSSSAGKRRCAVERIGGLFLLLALIVACYGGYWLYREQRAIQAQLQSFVTSADIERQAVLLAEQNEQRVAAHLQRIQAIENGLAAQLKDQQATLQAVRQLEQSVKSLGQEYQKLTARIDETRRTSQGNEESVLKNEIMALVRMAQDQLEFNYDPVRARELLVTAGGRLKRLSVSGLDSLREAIGLDVARLEQFVEVDRTAILARLIALEAAFSRAELKSAPAVVRLGSSVEPPHSVVDQTLDGIIPEIDGIQARLKHGWDLFATQLGGYIRIHHHAPRPMPLPEPLDVGRLQAEIRQWFGIARVSLFTDESDAFSQAINAIADLLTNNFELDSTGLRADFDDLRALGNQPIQVIPQNELKAMSVLQSSSARSTDDAAAEATGVEE